MGKRHQDSLGFFTFIVNALLLNGSFILDYRMWHVMSFLDSQAFKVCNLTLYELSSYFLALCFLYIPSPYVAFVPQEKATMETQRETKQLEYFLTFKVQGFGINTGLEEHLPLSFPLRGQRRSLPLVWREEQEEE